MEEGKIFIKPFADTSSYEVEKDVQIEFQPLCQSTALLSEKIERVEVEAVTTLEGHTERVWCVAWHPTLNVLASASADATVKLWALEADYASNTDANVELKENSNCDSEHDMENDRACTIEKEQCNKLHVDDCLQSAGITTTNINANYNKATSSISSSTFTSPPPSAFFNNNQRQVIKEAEHSTTTTNTVVKKSTLDDAFNESHWHCVCTLSGEHTRTIRHVSWSPSGNYLACASFDHTVSVWQRVYDDGELLLSFEVEGILDGHESEVKCVAWGSDNILATCARDHNVWIWERVEEGEYECAGILTGHLQDIKHCLWEPQHDMTSHQRVLSCGYDNTIKVWSDSSIRQEDWHCVQTIKMHTGTVWAASFQKTALLSSNPNTASTTGVKTSTGCSDDAKCEENTNKTLPSLLVQHDNKMEQQKSSSPLLCTCSDDLSLLFWRRRECDDRFEHVASCSGFCTRSVFAVDWSMHVPNLLAAVSGDNSITLLHVREDNTEYTYSENEQVNADIVISDGTSNNIVNSSINSSSSSSSNNNNITRNNNINKGDADNVSHDDNHHKGIRAKYANSVHVEQLLHLDNAHDADVNSVSFANTTSSSHYNQDDNKSAVNVQEKQKLSNTTMLMMATGGDDYKVKLWRVNIIKS